MAYLDDDDKIIVFWNELRIHPRLVMILFKIRMN